MTVGDLVPWQRYAVIVQLAELLKNSSHQFGKTALMKLLYLLQELKGVDLDYQYSLYTYGPFTTQVLADLDYTGFLRGVVVSYLGPENGGYEIAPGDQAQYIKDKAESKLSQWSDQISSIVSEFGSRKTAELELIATAIYAFRDAVIYGEPIDKETLIKRVHGIKPKFEVQKIQQEIEDLIKMGHIVIAPSENSKN